MAKSFSRAGISPKEHGMAQIDDEYHTLSMNLAEKILLPKVQQGELWAIQNVLRLVAEALDDGVRIKGGIANYVANALRRIHAGEKSDTAFGIKRKRGEKDNRKARAKAFLYAHQIEYFRMTEHLSLEVAIAKVAEAYGATEDTVKRGWKINHKEAHQELKMEQQYLGRIIRIKLP
jgi:hypothetical protein